MKKSRFRSFSLLFFMVGGLAFLSACAQVSLYENLTEKDANECLITLQENGVSAQKVKGGSTQEVSWSIQVSKKDTNLATKILKENNCPKFPLSDLEKVCKGAFIATPEQEKCRRDFIKKGDIVNLLQQMDGVVQADVVLNIPEIPDFVSETQPSKRPTASANIKVLKVTEGVEVTESKIQHVIAKSVANLDPRDVEVYINYLQRPSKNVVPTVAPPPTTQAWTHIGNLKISPDSKMVFKVYALVFLGLLLAVSIGLVLSLLKLTKMRQQMKMTNRLEIGAPSGQNAKLIQGPESGEPAQIQTADQNINKS